MRTILWVVVVLCFLPGLATAQEKAKPEDPFDLSETDRQIRDLGIPSARKVTELTRQGMELFESGDCVKALPVLEKLARQSNWLANLIVTGIRPVYKERAKQMEVLQMGARYEGESNQYKATRNKAMVMQAECFLKLGRPAQGLSLLVSALNVMSIDDGEVWTRARERLYEMIELK